jgi:hypothetical protein
MVLRLQLLLVLASASGIQKLVREIGKHTDRKEMA